MYTEEYKRVIARMNEVRMDDQAVILVTLRANNDVSVATFGHPHEIEQLKKGFKKLEEVSNE